MKVNAQFKKGVVEMCALALIAREDLYGYELMERISQQIHISEGTIYPILRRLTLEGYFETYLKESSEGPPRKYYRSTLKGRRAAKDIIGDWSQFVHQVNILIQSSATQKAKEK